jgi:hypothetical protein
MFNDFAVGVFYLFDFQRLDALLRRRAEEAEILAVSGAAGGRAGGHLALVAGDYARIHRPSADAAGQTDGGRKYRKCRQKT